MKQILLALAALAFVSCAEGSDLTAPAPEGTATALVTLQAAGALPGRYIVTLRDGASSAAIPALLGVKPDRVYTRALNGFAARLPEAALQALLRDGRVLAVEPDGVVRTTTVQTNPTWGLDRIDQRELPLNDRFRYTNTGLGVTAYVIDTGIRFDHTQFGGRATSLIDVIDGGTADDCAGHGTHVAGTIGGSTYGVAKGVSLVAVRVLDCAGFGTWSGVIAGIDAVIAAHADGAPAVANLSLGGEKRSAVNAAIKNLIADGVTTVVSAGNEYGDACERSPASTKAAITIGASNVEDVKPGFSNFGSCVDWFAPGVSIKSAYNGSSTATAFLSGTSMAAPHSSGVAALYLQSNPAASPAGVRGALFARTTKNLVTSSSTANNHLLFARY